MLSDGSSQIIPRAWIAWGRAIGWWKFHCRTSLSWVINMRCSWIVPCCTRIALLSIFSSFPFVSFRCYNKWGLAFESFAGIYCTAWCGMIGTMPADLMKSKVTEAIIWSTLGAPSSINWFQLLTLHFHITCLLAVFTNEVTNITETQKTTNLVDPIDIHCTAEAISAML